MDSKPALKSTSRWQLIIPGIPFSSVLNATRPSFSRSSVSSNSYILKNMEIEIKDGTKEAAQIVKWMHEPAGRMGKLCLANKENKALEEWELDLKILEADFGSLKETSEIKSDQNEVPTIKLKVSLEGARLVWPVVEETSAQENINKALELHQQFLSTQKNF